MSHELGLENMTLRGFSGYARKKITIGSKIIFWIFLVSKATYLLPKATAPEANSLLYLPLAGTV